MHERNERTLKMKRKILNERVGILAAKIIARAIKDIKGENLTFYQKKHRKEYLEINAKNFLKSNTCKFYCECLGVDYIKIINQIRRYDKCQM
ncbi:MULTISPECIES: hypothetical protein [Clostridium]|uniref:hypothetical protein n=1 Tax=Clostridium TaxID=1485 RepID=UPI0004D56021|nr:MULTISPECIES: hypothetical protein [Clostridium]KEI06191.1 hypothetical protein Z957_p0170 [Clostridium sp. K25]MCD3217460.1 hypothetical protein [Clostridium botulinum C]